jgi:outer membrane receptor protein involved in Fe transport
MAVSNTHRLQRSALSAALMSALLLTAHAAAAQENQQPAGESGSTEEAVDLDKVTVVGSRIKRAEIEGPAPVTVITRADIDREGFQTVGDMLQTLTQNTTSSFTGELAVTGFTPNAQVVNLRNLGPGYTLTLINGRRPAQYPQPYNRDNNVVNIRAIPSSIIERVEVLTGGASAIYGSDAVAGVVNIVTRENFEGNNIALTVGTTAEGGGDSSNLEYTGGRTGENWTAMWALQYGNEEPIFASQRDFLSDTRNGPRGAFTNPALSLATLRWNGVSPTTSVYYPGQEVCDRFGYTTVTTAARGTYCGSFTQPGSRSISNKNEFYSAYGHGTYDLSDNLRLFGSATLYQSDSAASSGTEFWATQGDQFNRSIPTASAPNGSQRSAYFDPQFNAVTFLQRVLNPFELGGPEAATTLFDEKTYDVLAGVSGTLAERYDWEVSADHSRYEYTADRPRLLSQAVHDYFLGPRLGYQTVGGVSYPIYRLDLNRWTNPITPDIYQSISTRAINKGETESTSFNANISGDLFELPAGMVSFAGILEGVRQSVDLQSDPRTDQNRPLDSQTIFNLTSSGRTVGERDRYAAGVEFRVPILSSLTAQIAGRYDKYDDITAVDDAVSQMYGLEWRPFDNLLIRGSYSTSFRAPDMQLVYAEGAASFSGILDEYACRAGVGVAAANGPRTRTACNTVGDPTLYTAQTVIAGNPLLEEEKGESYGAGFVWDIVDSMSVTVDYWRIKLEDQATQLSSAFLLENEANCRLGVRRDGTPYPNAVDSTFCQNIFGLVTRQGDPAVGPIQRLNSAYINASLSDTSGIDATYKYRLDTDRMGTFNLELGYSILLTNKFKEFDDQVLTDFRDVPANDGRSRVRGVIGWNKDDWSVNLFGTRFGESTSFAGVDGVDAVSGKPYSERLAPYMLYNLQFGKKFGDNVRADFTIVNVTNNQYREDNSNTAYPFFSPFVGADPAGRRFFLKLNYKF